MSEIYDTAKKGNICCICGSADTRNLGGYLECRKCKAWMWEYEEKKEIKSSFVVSPKYELGSWVQYISKEEPNSIKSGLISGYQIYKSQHYKPDGYMLNYVVIPEEFVNVECDEQVIIPECNTSNLPRII